MLEKLKAIDPDRIQTEDAIELIAMAMAAKATYDMFEVPPPAWLTDGIASLTREIRMRRQDMLQKRLREIEASKATLRSREERRADLDAEEAKLRAQLAS